MNYQPLFELMSEHGLTLLESEMDEIVDVVNGMQQPKPKKLTYLEFERLANISPSYPDLYDAIFHYLADEQPAAIELTSSDTKPEPSRLEVAAMILANNLHIGTSQALRDADELIKQAKG